MHLSSFLRAQALVALTRGEGSFVGLEGGNKGSPKNCGFDNGVEWLPAVLKGFLVFFPFFSGGLLGVFCCLRVV